MLAYLSIFYKPFINLEIISIKQIFIFIGRFKFTLIKKLFRLPQKKKLGRFSCFEGCLLDTNKQDEPNICIKHIR